MFQVPSSITHISFDAVGTLLFPSPSVFDVYHQIGLKYGSQYSREQMEQRFQESFDSQERFDQRLKWETSEEREIARWRAIVTSVLDDATDPEQCFQDLFDHFAKQEAWSWNEEFEAVVEECHRREINVVISSNFDSRLRLLVDSIPALRVVDYVLISSQIGFRKPAKQFFTSLLELVDDDPDQLMHIGDSISNDINPAMALGITAVHFSPSGESEVPFIRDVKELVF